MILALFDVDGTLVRGASTERRFFRWLLGRGHIRGRQVLAFAWFNLRWFPVYGRHTAKKNKAYLLGLAEATIAREAHEFVMVEVMPTLNSKCVERLREHQSAGDRVVLITGTLQVIGDALGAMLGVAEVIATHCIVRDGRYGWQPPKRHPFGQEKNVLGNDLLESANLPAAEAFAYGDSIHDLPLLENVGHAICVDPDSALRRHAEVSGWEIMEAGVEYVADTAN